MKILACLFLVINLTSFSQIITNTHPESADSASTEIFHIVEEMPEPPGGIQAFYGYIRKNLVYPENAKKAGIEGRVYVKFIVHANGSISDVIIKKGIPECKECDDEAVRLISSYPEKWKPGKQKDKPVPVYYNLPINFAGKSKK